MATQGIQFYAVILRPTRIWSGVVTAIDPTGYPFNSITVTLTGQIRTPKDGMTVQVRKSDGSPRGISRFRKLTLVSGSSYTLKMGTTPETNPFVVVGDLIYILEEFKLWPKFPVIQIVPGISIYHPNENAVFYEDNDIAFTVNTGDTQLPPPIAVAGPPFVGFAPCTGSFVGNQSYSVQSTGSSTLSYAWSMSAPSGTALTSLNIAGTAAAPVKYSFPYPGQYLVSLTVTDSLNSKTHTAYTYAFVAEDPNLQYTLGNNIGLVTSIDQLSLSADYSRGGSTLSFTARNILAINWGTDGLPFTYYDNFSAYPAGTMIVLFYTGTLSSRTATWPFRDNVLFVGYLTRDTTSLLPEDGFVQFNASTIDGLMRVLSVYPCSLEDTVTPQKWTQFKNLYADKAIVFLATLRSTLASMTPMLRMDPAMRRFRWKIDFGTGNLWSQITQELTGHWIQMCSSMQGVLYSEINYQYALDSERTRFTTRSTISQFSDWDNKYDADEISRWAQAVSGVKTDGISYIGGGVGPTGTYGSTGTYAYISGAPYATSPNIALGQNDVAYGTVGSLESQSKFVLTTQADLNARTGRMFFKMNNPIQFVRTDFINRGDFDVAPQEKFNIGGFTVVDANAFAYFYGVTFTNVAGSPLTLSTGTTAPNTPVNHLPSQCNYIETSDWVNPQNALVADGSFAYNRMPYIGHGGTCGGLDASIVGKYLMALNPNPNLPITAAITGIQVTISTRADNVSFNTGAPYGFRDYDVRLVINGAPVGQPLDKLPVNQAWGVFGGANRISTGTATSQVYGNRLETWGQQLTPTIVNSSNFGVAAAYIERLGYLDSGTDKILPSIFVDSITMSFYYNTGAIPTIGAIPRSVRVDCDVVNGVVKTHVDLEPVVTSVSGASIYIPVATIVPPLAPTVAADMRATQVPTCPTGFTYNPVTRNCERALT